MKKQNEWVCTDPNCNQFRKELSNKIFSFKEDRLINPITKKVETYSAEIDLDDYEIEEIIDICNTFGYDKETVTKWIETGSENALIAECIFEMDSDNY